MSNIAPTSSTDTAAVLLDGVRAVRRGAAALAGLEPDAYARGHAAFECLSDQRRLIAEHLAGRLTGMGDGPISVLSVGCGDGSLDARLAAGLVQGVPGRPVRYVGVDPWVGSAERFAATMSALGADELSSDAYVAPFDDSSLDETFDVVMFVHSMYYVPDLGTTLRVALGLLRPGGQLWVAIAPTAALNALVVALAPPLEGHRQWFSADVEKAFVDAGIFLDDVIALDAQIDLASASDEVLDFAVQARLTPDLRGPVRAYLDAVSVPGTDGRPRVPHPVDVFVATRR
ncbi:class I SAM-dependent methyltransferase [Rhodococcus sp. ARC_M12]|uniref:class I SAM-dependent methyltransferase n=1 Tax=unclassified Rhodococcus (in: high G+C Gram-positive bacteria) TaxID=192944 RepID=UPI001FB1EFE3|nr:MULTISPECIES: methyltransferase domain-containing protein [unclassified Rhodococcus (in: high G+C Gram-positive bacteria)]MCJ0891512.1 class I SAM-dependent methyltransferase [Rhodococcus sp. ARC_M5]MCJ0980865.1 class I SAM-dependent methyltransferase [Rhodococcus sp. ARC_M12]